MQGHQSCLFVTFKITETWEIISSPQSWKEQNMKDTFGSQELKIICELEFSGEGFVQDPDHNSISKIWKLNVWKAVFSAEQLQWVQDLAWRIWETLFCWLWEVKTPNSKDPLLTKWALEKLQA